MENVIEAFIEIILVTSAGDIFKQRAIVREKSYLNICLDNINNVIDVQEEQQRAQHSSLRYPRSDWQTGRMVPTYVHELLTIV